MNRYNILLDLDQTLIASVNIDEVKKDQNNQLYLQTYEFAVMPGYYIIFARPHLQEFLDFLFKHFNVSVWTAASREYAMFIVEKFILTKPDRKLDFFFYSYHTNLAIKESKKLKDITMIWRKFDVKNYNSKNTYIIDDNDDVYTAQPKNTIQIRPFNHDESRSFRDREFTRIIKILQKII
jgi:TFIIF-interacting CTD phosphatase-like protein